MLGRLQAAPREVVVATGARVFGATTVLLVLATNSPSVFAVTTAAALCVLSLTMSVLTAALPERLTTVAVVEAIGVGVLAGLALPDFSGGLAYVLVPPFVAALHKKWVPPTFAVALQIAGLIAVALTDPNRGTVPDSLGTAAPFVLIAIGAALLAHWLVDGPAAPLADVTGYESARRLLTQLRTVARRLSAGLDPVDIAQQILAEVGQRVTLSTAVVLARGDGTSLQALAEHGDGAARALTAEDPLVMDAWTNEAPAQRPVAGMGSPGYIRVAIPLLVGARVVGVIVVDTDRTLTSGELKDVAAALSEHCLRLDTAMLFDEVRSIATAEERRRLAREIHDGIAQEIASLGYLVDGMVADAAAGPQRDHLAQLRSELTRLTSELRLSIFDLRTEVSPTVSLGAVLSDHVRLIGGRSGMTVHVSLAESQKRLPSQTETEILRIAQEAITNARKHSGARNLHVSLSVEPPYAQLVVTDDGRGLGIPRDDSFGMRTMRERADRIGATLRVRSRTTGASGTEVILVIDDRRTKSRVVARPIMEHVA